MHDDRCTCVSTFSEQRDRATAKGVGRTAWGWGREAKERAEAKRREQAAILRMSNQGLSMEEIAIFLDLSLAEVEAIVQAAQSEQN